MSRNVVAVLWEFPVNTWRRLKEIARMFRVPGIVSVCMPEPSGSNIQLTIGGNSGGRTGVTHLILDRELDA